MGGVSHKVVILDQYGNPLKVNASTNRPVVGAYLVDEDGELIPGKFVDGKFRVSTLGYLDEVGEGHIDGHSLYRVTGYNGDIGVTRESIWDKGGLIPYLTEPQFMWISSTDPTDDQVWVVYGLDENWDYHIVSVTADGQNQVKVGDNNEKFIRVFGHRNTGTTDNAGNVYIAEQDTLVGGVPQTTSKIHCLATIGNNVSQKGSYTVPAGKMANITDVFVSNSSLKSVILEFRVRLYGQRFFVFRSLAIYQSSLGLPISAKGNYAEKTDFEFSAYSSVAGGIVTIGVGGRLEDAE